MCIYIYIYIYICIHIHIILRQFRHYIVPYNQYIARATYLGPAPRCGSASARQQPNAKLETKQFSQLRICHIKHLFVIDCLDSSH